MKTLLCGSNFRTALANATGRERRSDGTATGAEGPIDRRDLTMIATGELMTLVTSLGLRWGECGENPAVFCYRIGIDLMAPLCGHVSAQGDLP
jgi:hypothetical protein